jgi:hypothetical protein
MPSARAGPRVGRRRTPQHAKRLAHVPNHAQQPMRLILDAGAEQQVVRSTGHAVAEPQAPEAVDGDHVDEPESGAVGLIAPGGTRPRPRETSRSGMRVPPWISPGRGPRAQAASLHRPRPDVQCVDARRSRRRRRRGQSQLARSVGLLKRGLEPAVPRERACTCSADAGRPADVPKLEGDLERSPVRADRCAPGSMPARYVNWVARSSWQMNDVASPSGRWAAPGQAPCAVEDTGAAAGRQADGRVGRDRIADHHEPLGRAFSGQCKAALLTTTSS